MKSKPEVKSVLRREQDILDRLDNVKRLIEMETTLRTATGTDMWGCYCLTGRNGERISDDLLHTLMEEIQMQLLSITALCYGDNPDLGEPAPMLAWKFGADKGGHPADRFHDMWDECLEWNA